MKKCVLTFVILLLASCENKQGPGEMRSFRESIDRGGAELVRAEISMGAGELQISGGASKLVEAAFESDRPNFTKPEMRYDGSSFRGVLTVKDKQTNSTGATKTEWKLRFNDETPLDLRLSVGAGEDRLNLKTLSLRSLEVAMGAGQVDLDISGDYKHSVNVNVNGGIGQAIIHLPKTIGVRVDAKGGIGSVEAKNMHQQDGYYVNDAYKSHKVGMNVQVRGGIGEIKLVVD